MNSSVSVSGVLVVALALVALWFGWRRGSAVLAIVGALVLAMAAFNVLAGRR